MLDLLNRKNKIVYGTLDTSPPKLTIISTNQQRIDDIGELAFLYNEYACADDKDLTEDGKEIKTAIWKLLRPLEYKEQTSDSWGKCLGYTGTACPMCGRYRLELYENGKRVCEKCNWCVEDGIYRDVYAEEDERMWDEYRKSYDVCKEK